MLISFRHHRARPPLRSIPRGAGGTVCRRGFARVLPSRLPSRPDGTATRGVISVWLIKDVRTLRRGLLGNPCRAETDDSLAFEAAVAEFSRISPMWPG
jgi:hypothetical protein